MADTIQRSLKRSSLFNNNDDGDAAAAGVGIISKATARKQTSKILNENTL